MRPLKKKWDIKHTPTSPFNSKANGKVEAAVKSDKRPHNKTAKGGDDFYLGFLPSAKFWPSGRRGDKVAPGARPKAWSSKKQSLRIVCAIFCRQQSSTKKINLDFSLEQLRWLPLKWLILFQNETQGTRLGFPSLRYWAVYFWFKKRLTQLKGKNIMRLSSPIRPEVGGECCMQDKASLFPQPAGAKRGLRILSEQSYKRIMKYCFVHLQSLQGKEIWKYPWWELLDLVVSQISVGK